MIVQPNNPDELYALCRQAVALEMRRVYLHTDTWRGEYWPWKQSFLNINRAIFPEGESDLKALADFLLDQGVGLAVHTVSLVIGGLDPDYTEPGLIPGWRPGYKPKCSRTLMPRRRRSGFVQRTARSSPCLFRRSVWPGSALWVYGYYLLSDRR